LRRPWADHASGLLLHPPINGDFDEYLVIQGHRMRLTTVDLTSDNADIQKRLMELTQLICKMDGLADSSAFYPQSSCVKPLWVSTT
jgi:hypothetical protein